MKKILILLAIIFAGCSGPNYTCLYEVWDLDLKTYAYTVHNKEKACETEYINQTDQKALRTPITQRAFSNEAVGELGNNAMYRNKKLKEDQIKVCLEKKKLYWWKKNIYCH